jgi:hypothetical protein
MSDPAVVYAVLRFDPSIESGWKVIATVSGAVNEKEAVEMVVIHENDKGEKTALLGEFRGVRIDNAYTLKAGVDAV